MFESDNEKVVIFSQWERMTRLVAAELENMNVGYEYLHGGVPSAKRKALIDNFRIDNSKRVFLSTDAGGVGLNLQSANVVINLDLPWNPAVLEQRIARVHRLGQQKNVRVINLIAKDTIEHRILSVIGFKKSLFAGVLDGGEDRIVLDDKKFGKLMQTVEELTVKQEEEPVRTFVDLYDEAELEPVDDTAQKTSANQETPVREKTKEASGSFSASPAQMDDLLKTGLGFIEKLGYTFAALQQGEIKVSDFVEKDEKTGQTNLKIPVKSEETVSEAINAIAGFFNKLAGK
jgi:superfamily II DNA/RNA helicase